MSGPWKTLCGGTCQRRIENAFKNITKEIVMSESKKIKIISKGDPFDSIVLDNEGNTIEGITKVELTMVPERTTAILTVVNPEIVCEVLGENVTDVKVEERTCLSCAHAVLSKREDNESMWVEELYACRKVDIEVPPYSASAMDIYQLPKYCECYKALNYKVLKG